MKKIDHCLVLKAAEMYESGLSTKVCAKRIGCHKETLRKKFNEIGISMRDRSSGITPHNKINNLPELSICNDYICGVSENSLSKKHSVSRNVIRRILTNNKVAIRSQSESEVEKWKRMNQEQRDNQVRNAHASMIDYKPTDDTKHKIAISREINTPDWFIGFGEKEFLNKLNDIGVSYFYQKAIMSYNIDFLIDGIAYELTAQIGRNVKSKKPLITRAKSLYDCGIKTLAIEFKSIDELISNIKRILEYGENLNNSEWYYSVIRIQNNTMSYSAIL